MKFLTLSSTISVGSGNNTVNAHMPKINISPGIVTPLSKVVLILLFSIVEISCKLQLNKNKSNFLIYSNLVDLLKNGIIKNCSFLNFNSVKPDIPNPIPTFNKQPI